MDSGSERSFRKSNLPGSIEAPTFAYATLTRRYLGYRKKYRVSPYNPKALGNIITSRYVTACIIKGTFELVCEVPNCGARSRDEQPGGLSQLVKFY